MNQQARIQSVFLLLAIFLIGVSLCLPAEEPADAEPDDSPPPARIVEVPAMGVFVPAKCINVVDGDTIDVIVQIKVRVRLDGCWAPETHGVQKEAGLRAKFAMKKLAEGQPGVLMVPWKDSLKDMLTLDRVVGGFMVNGVDVAKEQVFKKLAGKTKEDAEKMFPVK